MKHFLIAVGGSGAKSLEAFVHMSAAGLLGNNSLKTFYFDQDESNGSLSRSHEAIRQYRICRDFERGSIEAFAPDIGLFDPVVCRPLPSPNKRSLKKFFSYDDPAARHQNAARLMDTFFTPDQIAAELDDGFLGNPSIGSAIIGGTLNLDTEAPWNTLYGEISAASSNDGGANVLLVGSVFGGTGAAGIPTIAKLLRPRLAKDQIKNVRIGAVLVLPYFSFKDVKGAKVRADARDFLPNTQAALNYYHDRDYLDIFDAVYLTGEHALTEMTASALGGKDQRNDPHPIELYTALAALDFFMLPGEAKGCMLTARQDENIINWEDLPAPPGVSLRVRIGQFARFSFAYLSAFYPAVVTYLREKQGHRIPWLKNIFGDPVVVNDQALHAAAENLRAECEAFLWWLGAMHHSAERAGVRMNLIATNTFCEFSGTPPATHLRRQLQPKDFENLLLPARKKEGLGIDDVFRAMADFKRGPTTGQGFGVLINSLYSICGRGLQ